MSMNITAFMGSNVFIGDGRILENASVVIRGSKIHKVAKNTSSIPKDANKISLTGCTLIPGLIDCHTHICLDGGSDPFGASKSDSYTIKVLKAAQNAKKTLFTGVTTIRDMGGVDGIDIEIRDAISSGLILGPRIFASGHMICITGGHGWLIGREVDGNDEIVKAVREQIKYGSDLVKFIVTGGVMTHGTDPGAVQMTEQELKSGIKEAHKAGRKTAAHAKGGQGIINALRAGIDSIEHGTVLTEEAISIMLERNVPIIFTLSALYNMEHKGVKAGLSKEILNKALLYKPERQESITMAKDAGVSIAMGTDAGTPFNLHGDNLDELERFVEVGFSPAQALKAATGTAAQVLGIDKYLGTIEEGKLADLIIVKGDPLQDISLLNNKRSIKLIVKEGNFIYKDNDFCT